MEKFAKPGAGGIIEKREDGIDYILIQERFKEGAEAENGLLEIPAGKIREFESIYECLKREINEETGLVVLEIEGEVKAAVYEADGYRVLDYEPFTSAQNIEGYYPIMVQTFLCRVKGDVLSASAEAKNIRWISISELKDLIEKDEKKFYPMHVIALKKYLRLKKHE